MKRLLFFLIPEQGLGQEVGRPIGMVQVSQSGCFHAWRPPSPLERKRQSRTKGPSLGFLSRTSLHPGPFRGRATLNCHHRVPGIPKGSAGRKAVIAQASSSQREAWKGWRKSRPCSLHPCPALVSLSYPRPERLVRPREAADHRPQQ